MSEDGLLELYRLLSGTIPTDISGAVKHPAPTLPTLGFYFPHGKENTKGASLYGFFSWSSLAFNGGLSTRYAIS